MNKRRILIVDDDLAINEAMSLILEDAGYGVIATSDSTQVMEMIKQRPDLILLDIWMPYIDGREVCKMLKSDSSAKHIPVIMVSATRDTETIAKSAGADDFLIKPFEMRELLAKVAQHITNK